MDQIYCAEQIEVPPQLPSILKAYTKEVIRYNPADIPTFSRDYFTALVNGELQQFLDQQAKHKASAQVKPVAATPAVHPAAVSRPATAKPPHAEESIATKQPSRPPTAQHERPITARPVSAKPVSRPTTAKHTEPHVEPVGPEVHTETHETSVDADVSELAQKVESQANTEEPTEVTA